MDSVRDTILKFVLNRRGAEQEHILFNDLSSLVQSLSSSVDRRRCLIVQLRPGGIFRIRNLARCDTECPKSFSGVFLR